MNPVDRAPYNPDRPFYITDNFGACLGASKTAERALARRDELAQEPRTDGITPHYGVFEYVAGRWIEVK